MSAPESPCSVRAEVREMVDREIGHLRELIERTISEKDKALELQRNEYHRRLDQLNDAQGRAEHTATLTVPRETFDLHVMNHDKRMEDLTREVANNRAIITGNQRIVLAIVTLIGLIISSAALWVKFK